MTVKRPKRFPVKSTAHRSLALSRRRQPQLRERPDLKSAERTYVVVPQSQRHFHTTSLLVVSLEITNSLSNRCPSRSIARTLIVSFLHVDRSSDRADAAV
jgi:hypothetical protein